MKFHARISQPFLIDLNTVELKFQEEIADFSSVSVMESVSKAKGVLIWLTEEARLKYPVTSSLPRGTLIHFSSSYQVLRMRICQQLA